MNAEEADGRYWRSIDWVRACIAREEELAAVCDMDPTPLPLLLPLPWLTARVCGAGSGCSCCSGASWLIAADLQQGRGKREPQMSLCVRSRFVVVMFFADPAGLSASNHDDC